MKWKVSRYLFSSFYSVSRGELIFVASKTTFKADENLAVVYIVKACAIFLFACSTSLPIGSPTHSGVDDADYAALLRFHMHATIGAINYPHYQLLPHEIVCR